MKADYINKTQKWVQEFVINNNLCPFAKRPFDENKIVWKALEISQDFDQKLNVELAQFLNEEKPFDTKFLIIPFLANFDDFVEVFYLIEDLAIDANIDHELEFVSFHPQSQYGDSDPDDAINFANRSPFPMIQLLRKQDLDALQLNEERKSEILNHNKRFLEGKGSVELTEELNGYK